MAELIWYDAALQSTGVELLVVGGKMKRMKMIQQRTCSQLTTASATAHQLV